MNEFTDFYSRRAKAFSGRHAPEVVSARTSKRWRRLRRGAAVLTLTILAIVAAVYFIATASLTLVLAAAGVLALLVGLVVAFGFYVMDNVP